MVKIFLERVYKLLITNSVISKFKWELFIIALVSEFACMLQQQQKSYNLSNISAKVFSLKKREAYASVFGSTKPSRADTRVDRGKIVYVLRPLVAGKTSFGADSTYKLSGV